jgi:quinol monooxygenase YgiN
MLETDWLHVSWWVELAVKPNELANFEKLTAQMVNSTRAETGVLAYQRFISDDRQTVHVHESYESSAAAIAHLQKFAAIFGERYASMVERKRFSVFGNRVINCGTCWTATEQRITSHSGHLRIGANHTG